MRIAFALPLALLALSACTTLDPADCTSGAVRLTQDFSTAPGYACTRTGPSAFRLEVVPESPDINPSPWYAFDLHARRAGPVTVELDYDGYTHRYVPKLETGDGNWTPLPEADVRLGPDSRVATISVTVGPDATRIAAQEVIGAGERARWRAEFADRAGLARATIGHSIEGRPIEALSRSASAPGAPLVILIGGQHPPEVTGVLGLRAFLEALFADTGSAAALDSYDWLIVPDLNPDGVERGHWRENLGDTDLNRDWGPFAQPETAAVRDEIDRRLALGQRPVLLLDFHSTRRDVLYTPPDDLELAPDNFSADWIALIEHHWTGDGPAFDRGPGHNPGLPTAKSWFAETFGAPGITVEFGDETDRGRVAALAEAAAAALRSYLERETEPGTAG